MPKQNDLQSLCGHQQPGDGRDLVPPRRGLPQGGPAGLRLLHPLRRRREEDQGDEGLLYRVLNEYN